MKTLNKLCIVCGGTGGHFYPGISIARTFKQKNPEGEILLLLSGRHVIAQSEYAAKYDLRSVIIPASERPRGPLSLVTFTRDLILGSLKAYSAVKTFKPDALLAMGSFASVPNIVAALLRKVPVFLHDGNARIGRANAMFSRFARHIGTAFPPVNADRLKCGWTWTGMPVRLELLDSQIRKADAIDKLNKAYDCQLKEDLPTILVFGGSQGALVFNQTIPAVLQQYNDSVKFQVVHLTGNGKYNEVVTAYQDVKHPKLLLETSQDMDLLYSAADLVICRSGGSTVAELCLFAKFAILVPYPYAADRHQDDNADFYQESGAGVVLMNNDFNSENVRSVLDKWLDDSHSFSENGLAAKEKAKPQAAETMLDIIENMIIKG